MVIFDRYCHLSWKRCEIGRWLLWNVNRKSWVPDWVVQFLMTLSDPNPSFKVTGYLKVKYLTDGVRAFNCTKHSCRSLAAQPKTCKKNWGSSPKFFFAKSAGRCFTPVMEIKHNSASLCWNFHADTQLIRGRFWLQLWMLKKFSEPRVSWKYLAKMWKNSKMRSQFAAMRRRWADRRSLLG